MSDTDDQPTPKTAPRYGVTGRLAAIFIDSKLTPIAVIASILLGLFAVLQLPREEEPQIKVPMIDVLVAMPGATPTEVENRVTRPMEKLLWEIPDVEYLYSTSGPGNALIIARFEVGTDIEAALIRLNQKLQTNYDAIPAGVSTPLIKPRTIDDVPILALTLHSATQDHLTLRRLGAQLDEAVKSVDQVAETTLIGGVRRAVRVALDPAALAAHGLDVDSVGAALQAANSAAQAGSRPFANTEILLDIGAFLRDATDVAAVVVGVQDNHPVYLRDVATITDGAEEPANYVLHGAPGTPLEAAVTLSVAKRPGANAIDVVEDILTKIDTLRGTLLPADVELTVTRDYGHTAAEKSNELLLHMGIAVFGVAVLILFFLGWRESTVVLLAIPSTLALTLLVFYLYGYTLNRITLFALIFSIGILVDDAIVVVENIVRHVRLPGARQKPLRQVALEAVDEVGNPTVLATWAVIAAILPMAFVGGLMGPYMRPIPIGSTAAMLFSLVIAFTITPWAALRVLRRRFVKEEVMPEAERSALTFEEGHGHGHGHGEADWSTRLYHRVMEPLLDSAFHRWAFLATIVVLLAGSAAVVLFGFVEVKMLPFDNKSEFQVIIDTPEGTTLEQTTAIAQEMAAAIQTAPEVSDFQIYAGTASPFNFNGLVRHYYMRRGPNVADIQVNLVGKHDRADQSHDIAKRIRPALAVIAQKHGANVAVAEVPPGPPVLQSLVAEIYGPDEEQRVALARQVRDVMAGTEGVVDLDWYVEDPQSKVRYVVDKEKAAFHGISTAAIARTLRFAARNHPVDLLHQPDEREDVNILLELPDSARTTPEELLALQVRSDRDPSAPLVALSELVRVERTAGTRSLYRKNLKPVTYVTADVAGLVESPAYALFGIHMDLLDIDARDYGATDPELNILHLNLPDDDTQPALKWDGEWHITLEVFRDLGIAFAAVLILIAMLMVGWFRSYVTPLVVMAAIPFSLIGILPAHWAMGAFFTATSMIGFMAGAGIVVRNSIILVDFIELRRGDGLALRDAVVEAGAVRFRPMLLTALAVVVGASVILADPIFQGLAISLMFGEIASLFISRMAVPVLYFMANQSKEVT
ncbi:efflux RND transporter permease subunit [Synoicihabitans lomoniglobus]|uniref:Efflux RND transporter permease subunit n=1 Tax=Synoicihabitans lomoniglobus TaxID=2909285 RepID=A0AAE9ZXA1_9BACT|nr:efflux RND transporter permease subunit [Opitutaceae bacterium LMO-M01]WED64784.1 efflux RND transporter permease subunit [Opitutaceae bacterium LMO-M01]